MKNKMDKMDAMIDQLKKEFSKVECCSEFPKNFGKIGSRTSTTTCTYVVVGRSEKGRCIVYKCR